MEDEKRISPKRLIVDIPEDWHAQIKAMASLKNMKMRKYVLRAVMKQVNEDKKLL